MHIDARCWLLVILLSSCSHSRPGLPAAYGDYRKVDNTLVFELPDTGGYMVNGVALDTAHLPGLLHEVFDQRLPYLRAAFVVDNPHRRWSDVEFLESRTTAAGVKLFDARKSGWPLSEHWQTIPLDSVH